MAKITENFKTSFSTAKGDIETNVVPKLSALDSALTKGNSIVDSIDELGIDIKREVAQASVASINTRIQELKDAVNALTPVAFASLWPAKKGDAIQKVIKAESK